MLTKTLPTSVKLVAGAVPVTTVRLAFDQSSSYSRESLTQAMSKHMRFATVLSL